VPCGTAAGLRELLARSNGKGVKHEILSNPEFLAEGSAIRDLLHPDRVIIGCEDTIAGKQATARLASLYKAWVPENCIISLNLWSSELAKLGANALLAQRISSINSLSAICEAVGADIHEVGRVCGLDRRIGPEMLRPSIGFGGSCFEKDIRSLVYLAEGLGLRSVAAYWMSVLDLNEYQKHRQTSRIVDFLHPAACDRVAILGFSFKKDTGDIRGTPALALVRDFADRGFQINIYDPRAKIGSIQEMLDRELPLSSRHKPTAIFSSASEACEQVHAIVIATAWDQFRTNSKETTLDWTSIACHMQEPKVLFDCCNVVKAGYLEGLGMKVVELGRRRALL
jgi:UDPglucose 6-dehydrogenase